MLTDGSDVNYRFPRCRWDTSNNRLQNSWHTLQNFGIFLMNFALQLKDIPNFPPPNPINVDHSFRHYGHFVSGQHCAGGRGGCFTKDWDTQKFAKNGQVCHQFCNRLKILGRTRERDPPNIDVQPIAGGRSNVISRNVAWESSRSDEVLTEFLIPTTFVTDHVPTAYQIHTDQTNSFTTTLTVTRSSVHLHFSMLQMPRLCQLSKGIRRIPLLHSIIPQEVRTDRNITDHILTTYRPEQLPELHSIHQDVRTDRITTDHIHLKFF